MTNDKLRQQEEQEREELKREFIAGTLPIEKLRNLWDNLSSSPWYCLSCGNMFWDCFCDNDDKDSPEFKALIRNFVRNSRP
jgi:hypothetical protein